ncbi:MAG: Rne/Rng family ribonuclease [Gammaproteobacteria bacterium]
MKRILINATQAEELRVAMVNGQRLYDLDIEIPSREQKKSNIYKGKITRIEPSLEAAFVNYGAERHGFLPFKEISKIYFKENARDDNGKLNIKDAIKVDQEIVVQIEKEERGNKGAALTSFISLAGRFLVAMPQNPRAGGVSRRIEGEDRDSVKKVMSEINMPEGMGVIVRTAGVGRSSEEMQWDLDYLSQVWIAVEKAAAAKKAPFLIYQESNIVIRALRDHYRSDVGEIIIDSPEAYQQAHDFMSMVMPNSLNKLKKFDDKLPLFNRFQIENQIESAFSREVTLPSGGAIVIDHTEALTSIDINSARATKGSDIEDTAKLTNLEAADEIARQLRIRDLGGLIVIDFIDMMQNKNQREVESRLRSAVYDDRARVQIGRISRFGLLEMSRQRLRPSLGESSQIVCPRCSGQGTIRDIESLSLAVLRLLEEESLKDSTGKILAKIPVECATYLLNEKRDKIDGIEQRHNVKVVVIPDPGLETPHYLIERVKEGDTHRHESNYKKSYELTTEDESIDPVELSSRQSTSSEVPAVQHVEPPGLKPPPATKKQASKEPGIVRKLISAILGSSESPQESLVEVSSGQNRGNRNTSRNRRGRYRGNANRNRNNTAKKTVASENQQAAKDSDTDQSSGKKAESGESRQPRPQKSRGNRQNRSGNRRPRDSRADKPEQSTAASKETSDKKPQESQDKASRSKPSSPKRSRRAVNGESRDGPSDSTSVGREESGSVESIPVESKAAESKPTESKPAESNPAKSKSAESKPVEAKPVESKPVEAKPVESQPVEPTAVESSSTEAPVKPVEKNVNPEINAEAFSAESKKPENKVAAEERKTPGTSSGAESLGSDPVN